MVTPFGRYNLLLKLGEGGMGAVYLACQKTLRRYCAIKVISPQFSRNQEAANRFLREARATAALSHPNLVGIYDCDQFEKQYFIAMEYIEGMTLGAVLRQHGALPLPLALYWLNQAAVGLEYIHGKGIVHRDIKPDNMIIDTTGVLKIMDLGLAKAHFEADHGMTVTGAVMGSPHYMSPEQINDSKTVDHRTDLYALGITFYHMVVGRVPFERTSATAVCLAHLQELMPSVNLPGQELTRSMDALILKLTAKKKEERFQAASELEAALASWLSSYLMDESAQAFFGRLGFEQQKVNHLLEKEGIDPSRAADDLGATVPVADVNFRTAYPPPPVLPQSRRSWHHYVAWATVALVVLVLAGGVFRGIAKKQKKNMSPPPVTQTTAPQETGGLVVETQPPRAVVILGPKSQLSPATFNDILPGQHSVKVSLDGYREVEQQVEIATGQTRKLKLTLEEINASVPGPEPVGSASGTEQRPAKGANLAGQIEHLLEKARGVSDEQWPHLKSLILDDIGRKLNVEHPENAKRVHWAMVEIGQLLGEARTLPADQYNVRKTEFIHKIKKALTFAAGKLGGRLANPPRGLRRETKPE